MTVAIIEESASLKGEIRAPPSKSYTHRAVIISSLAEGTSSIRFPLIANDISVTIEACRSFGAIRPKANLDHVALRSVDLRKVGHLVGVANVEPFIVEQLSVSNVTEHSGLLLTAPEKHGRARRGHLLPIWLDELVNLLPMNH